MSIEQPSPSPTTPPQTLTPPTDLFSRREERLRQLTPQHPLGSWLVWLANLCAAQQLAFDRLLLRATPASSVPKLAALQDIVPAFYDQFVPGFTLSIDELSQRVENNLRLARGEIVAAGRDRNDVLVTAAMQVVWTSSACKEPLPTPKPSGTEVCPCCGSIAMGSIVLAGDGKDGLRYQECCLCATRWNAVRARCTLCADGAVVHYLHLEGTHEVVGAETCDHCHGYSKIFFQAKDSLVEPLADDLATLALDVLVGEQGYARGTPNLFLCEGEST